MKWKGVLVNGSIMASLVLLVGGMGLIATFRVHVLDADTLRNAHFKKQESDGGGP